MRILITGCTYYPLFNGQAVFMVNLAEGLVRRGHNVMVLMPGQDGRASISERNGVKLWSLQAMAIPYGQQTFYYSIFPDASMGRCFKEFKPDIVHFQDHYPLSWYALWLARRHHIKTIGTNHFMPENLAPAVPWLAHFQKAYKWLGWTWALWVFQNLDVVTAPSMTAANIIREGGLRTPLYPVSCGIDLNRFRPDPSVDKKALRLRYGLDPQHFTFLYVGRVDGEKRLDVLIRALKLMKREDIQLVITGKGAAVPRWQKLAADLNLSEQVRFTGFVPEEDKPSLLNSADVFAMPSEAELLSIATLEAMGCGKPVLAAQIRALPELVDPGINGYLFKPGDPNDAARCMALLADHPEQLNAMGAASLKKVQPHGIDNILSSYERIYDRLLSGTLHTLPSPCPIPSGSKGGQKKPKLKHTVQANRT